MAALREIGYDDELVVEMSSPAGRAEHCIRQAAQDVRYILAL
jgi:sugar phosphate isomerase/epimerase